MHWMVKTGFKPNGSEKAARFKGAPLSFDLTKKTVVEAETVNGAILCAIEEGAINKTIKRYIDNALADFYSFPLPGGKTVALFYPTCDEVEMYDEDENFGYVVFNEYLILAPRD